jgi:phenylacetate-CoA ligase
VSDFIIDSKGGLVHGEYFTHLFYGLDGIEQFQLVQETMEKIRLRILPRNGFNQSVLDPVVEKIRQCIGQDIVVDVEICTTSFVEASGKFRFTISKVANGLFKGNI